MRSLVFLPFAYVQLGPASSDDSAYMKTEAENEIGRFLQEQMRELI